jgi:flavin-dependent dehydrogenase
MARQTPTVDVLVVGGGPAGLAAAIRAAEAGMSCVVIEPREGVIDKACGEGLMPAALESLQTLGVRIEGWPFRGIRYVSASAPELAAEGDLPAPGLGVRRAVLHGALLRRAQELGVRHLHVRAGRVVQSADVVEVAGLRARWLVAADGLHSRVRRDLGLDLPPRRPRRVGVRRHFRVEPWTDRVEVHWAPAAEAYVTPVGPEEVGVALLAQPPSRFDDLLRTFPALMERLGPPTTSVAGAGPFERRVRARVAGRVLLVGDAAGYVDPLTGEGVALALQSSFAAVEAVRRGRPQDYEAVYRRLVRWHERLTRTLLRLAARGMTRRALIPTLRRAPWLFDGALALLAGTRGGAGLQWDDEDASAACTTSSTAEPP